MDERTVSVREHRPPVSYLRRMRRAGGCTLVGSGIRDRSALGRELARRGEAEGGAPQEHIGYRG